MTPFFTRIAGQCLMFSLLLPMSAFAETSETIAIAPVWAGHPVGFSLLSHEDRQYVAFYDADRQMTVAERKLDGPEWTFTRLPQKVVWDSHNYIRMAIDDAGHIHLSGNMHGVPLVYFRTTRPGDSTSFEQVESMTGQEEKKCTYPEFKRGPRNEFLFTYRDGASGNGNQIYNVYDTESRTWKRLMDQPLTDGKGEMNAYFHGPVKGPDGYHHLAWVWRDTPDCATNHDLSYAKSRDLVNWETSTGTAVALPMTAATAEVVDPVPPGAGLINGCVALGFDSKSRPVLTYHKYDAEGKSQIYNARLEDGAWNRVQSTQWDHRWEFSGGGSIKFEVNVARVRATGKGELEMNIKYPGQAGKWVLDEETLKVKGKAPEREAKADTLKLVRSDFPGMQVNTSSDSGRSGEAGTRYVLRWETLPPNRDRPRKGALPPPGMLEVIKLTSAQRQTKSQK